MSRATGGRRVAPSCTAPAGDSEPKDELGHAGCRTANGGHRRTLRSDSSAGFCP